MEKRVLKSISSTIKCCNIFQKTSVVQMIVLCGIRSNKYSGRSLVLNLKKVHNFLNQHLNFRHSKPNSLYNLLWDVPLMAPVIQGQLCIEFFQFFVWNWYGETQVTSWKLKSTSWNSKARVEIQIHESQV